MTMIAKDYTQGSNSATLAKWRRMCHNLGWRGTTKWLVCGFSDWTLQKDDQGVLFIHVSTSYHVESTLDDMYKHNFSNWHN